MTAITLNNTVPLSAQVECPEGETLFVRAFIFDPNNAQLATRDMADQGDGLFTNNTFLMPNKSFIRVQYLTYTDAGYSILSDIFCPATETFTLDGEASETPVAGDDLVGIMENSIEHTGSIDQNEITGIIEIDPELIGTIIEGPELIGSIDTNEIIGIIEE